MVILLTLGNRKGDLRQYEIVSVLSPTKYLMSSKGWRGDAASDIPASLFPKHVQVYTRVDHGFFGVLGTETRKIIKNHTRVWSSKRIHSNLQFWVMFTTKEATKLIHFVNLSVQKCSRKSREALCFKQHLIFLSSRECSCFSNENELKWLKCSATLKLYKMISVSKPSMFFVKLLSSWKFLIFCL